MRTVAEPFVAGLHPIPKSALLPLFLVLMGIGEQPRLALVALAAFFPLLINTMNSVRSIEPAYLEAAGNYGAHGFCLLRRHHRARRLPGMLSGGRIAVNTAMTIAITTELLTSRQRSGCMCIADGLGNVAHRESLRHADRDLCDGSVDQSLAGLARAAPDALVAGHLVVGKAVNTMPVDPVVYFDKYAAEYSMFQSLHWKPANSLPVSSIQINLPLRSSP